MFMFMLNDPVVIDIRFYDKENKGKILDFTFVNKISIDYGKISLINDKTISICRKPTRDELIKYYPVNFRK